MKDGILVRSLILTIFLSSCTIFKWTVPKIEERQVKFIFPVDGEIISYFGKRKEGFHTGIDIKKEEGAPIKASADGIVSYAGSMERYGNVIILLHPDGFSTLYAHNKKNLVSFDQKVKQGDLIGLVGKTGNAKSAHLHFEIRKNDKPQDPLLYLKRP